MKKRNNSKKKNSKGNGARSQPAIVRLGKQPFPPQLYNTLKYAESINLTLNASGEASYVFSANGLYDPNISGTGHQPMYFDQLIAVYNHYTCLSSRIRITPYWSVVPAPYIVNVYIDDDSSGLIGLSANMERIGSINMAVNPERGLAPTLRLSWSARRTFGAGTQSDPNLQGNASSNPAEGSFYYMYVGGNIALASQAVGFIVSIEYDVVWDEYVTTGQS